MAGLNNMHQFPSGPADTGSHHHQRSKSSVLRSLMGRGGHKRNNSDGAGLPPAPLIAPIATTPSFHVSQQSLAPSRNSGVFHVGFDAAAAAAMEPERYAHALSELQQNNQDRSPERPRGRDRTEQAPPSPTKSGFSTLSFRPFGGRDRSKPPNSRDNASASPTKPKKVKSATNLVALLRPRSMKNLKQRSADDDVAKEKDKENRSPPNSLGSDHHAAKAPPPPIYAQFSSQNFGPPSPQIDSPVDSSSAASSLQKKPRPKSFQAYVTRRDDDTGRSAGTGGSDSRDKRMTWTRGSPAGSARPAVGPRSKSSTPTSGSGREMPTIDPKDIDKHLEAMLDRRNIPENQRYKMRNLSNTIKMEFIRQDWAEMQAKLERPSSHDGSSNLPAAAAVSAPGAGPLDQQDEGSASPSKKDKKKHGRGLSLTIVRGSGNKSNPSSPTKKKGDSSLGRHFRTKSSESLVSEPPSPFASGYTSTFLAKVKGQQLPGDFVAYLQKVQKPELVEVGKLHKLRLLLRNETVAWTDEFIRLGGMKEIVELLHRIMAVEWREEHEDALLHENLLCLKALCTTDMALQYLHSIHTTLFPALLHMIFDPEKKGPSEFTTRNIITSILLTYIETATLQERPSRARAVLGYLRDPEPKEEDRPLDFVLEMRRERPYRVWCKEVVNVTKEVFWIFLHHLNVVALPSADKPSSTSDQSSTSSALDGTGLTTSSANSTTTTTPHLTNHPPSSDSETTTGPYAYMLRHFPRERPPVPAAPYVGGVEWDATNYLASHLDLLNAILACTGSASSSSPAERNALRMQLRVSGWERCLGGSLRLCKEKFYGAVHDGLRTWVAAAAEDGWDVRDVRFGPAPTAPSSPVKSTTHVGGGEGSPGKGQQKQGKQKKGEGVGMGLPPRIEMPKLDFGIGGGVVGGGVGGGMGGGGNMLASVAREAGSGGWLS